MPSTTPKNPRGLEDRAIRRDFVSRIDHTLDISGCADSLSPSLSIQRRIEIARSYVQAAADVVELRACIKHGTPKPDALLKRLAHSPFCFLHFANRALEFLLINFANEAFKNPNIDPRVVMNKLTISSTRRPSVAGPTRGHSR